MMGYNRISQSNDDSEVIAKYSRRYAALKVRCDRDYISGLDNALGTTCQMQQVDRRWDNDMRDPPHPPSPTSPEIEKGNLVEKRRDEGSGGVSPERAGPRRTDRWC